MDKHYKKLLMSDGLIRRNAYIDMDENRKKRGGYPTFKVLFNCDIRLDNRNSTSFGKFFQLGGYISNQINASTLIEKEYVNPGDVQIVFPEQKKNLICIYFESAETIIQDKQNGGMFEYNYIPEMTEIAKENISFSRLDLAEKPHILPNMVTMKYGTIILQ